ncbi:MAG TPA: SPOR domain-containing protein [Steroidobacteraceae bacterium]|nr:SPOR domain-containing protein [Steroidobacteraceae bacterium]
MKERLTGAIILVALMVLLVPELLTGPIRSAPRAAPAAPSSEGAPLRSYTISLADDPKAASAPTPQPTSDPTAAPAEAAPPPAPQSTHAAEPSTASGANALPAPATASHAPPAAASPGASPAGSWAVQLGSFAHRANAERLARQVKAQGFKVSISQESAGRRLYRVRVGPAHDHAAASALASQLAAAGHRGAIVPK